MKSKFKDKIFNVLVFQKCIVGMFCFAMLSSLAPIANAQNGCNYTVSISSPNNKTTANLSDTVELTASVTKSGTSADCNNDLVSYRAQINYKNGWGNFHDRSTLTYSNAQASYNVAYSLSNLNRSLLPDPNSIEFRFIISRDTYRGEAVIPVTVAQSSVWKVSLGGALTSSGAVNISFTPNRALQVGEDFVISVYMSPKDVDALDPSITNIYYEFFINNKKAGTLTKSRAQVRSSSQYLNTTVTAANGFQGNNVIKVVVWQANTSIKIGEATGNVLAPALSNTTTPTPTTTPASGGTGSGTSGGNGSGGGTSNPLADCTGPSPDPNKCLYNPLPTSELTNMFLLLARGFFAIIGIWAVIFIIVGGFKMVMAQGNEEAYANAKKTVTWAVLGVVIALLSFSIVAIVQNILQTNIKTFVP